MTNQVNQAFEKWNTPHYVHEDGTKCDMTLAKAAFQAATQASESEINSLKQRVEELTTSNNQLREALTQLTALKFSTASHIQKLDAVDKIANKALSLTPAQSLAEHDNEVIERCAKVCNELINLRGADASHKFMAGKCAANIRALKGK